MQINIPLKIKLFYSPPFKCWLKWNLHFPLFLRKAKYINSEEWNNHYDDFNFCKKQKLFTFICDSILGHENLSSKVTLLDPKIINQVQSSGYKQAI
jgi:hypothetical protein